MIHCCFQMFTNDKFSLSARSIDFPTLRPQALNFKMHFFSVGRLPAEYGWYLSSCIISRIS